jgi:succinate-acetate transporter protein
VTESGVSEGFGFAMLAAYGLLWILAPNVVLRVVNTINSGKIRLPSSGVIRLFGALWLLAVLTMWFVSQ